MSLSDSKFIKVYPLEFAFGKAKGQSKMQSVKYIVE